MSSTSAIARSRLADYSRAVSNFQLASQGLYPGPNLPIGVLQQMVGSVDGLSSSDLVDHTRAAVGADRPSRGGRELREFILGGGFLIAGNKLLDRLRTINDDHEEDRTAADELSQDAEDCASAIDDVVHVSDSAIGEVLSAAIGLLDILAMVLRRHPVAQFLIPVISAIGGRIIEDTNKQVASTCRERDETIDSCYEEFECRCECICGRPLPPEAPEPAQCEPHQPQPKIEPCPEPEPESKPKPQPKPTPNPKPIPPDPAPVPKPVPPPAPDTDPEPAPKPVTPPPPTVPSCVDPAPEPEPEPAPKPVECPEPEPDPCPEPVECEPAQSCCGALGVVGAGVALMGVGLLLVAAAECLEGMECPAPEPEPEPEPGPEPEPKPKPEPAPEPEPEPGPPDLSQVPEPEPPAEKLAHLDAAPPAAEPAAAPRVASIPPVAEPAVPAEPQASPTGESAGGEYDPAPDGLAAQPEDSRPEPEERARKAGRW